MRVRLTSNAISRKGTLKRSGKNWCPVCKAYTPKNHKHE